MQLIQDARYFITEWDGTDEVVRVRNVGRGAYTTRERADGKPYLRRGGDVIMMYPDGETHRVSAKYFEQSLRPRLAFISMADFY